MMRALRYSALLLFGLSGCDGAGVDPCAGVDCSLHGTCEVVDGQAQCRCEDGYVALGLVCHPDYCAELDCQHGACIQNAELGRCECEAGWAGALCDACAEGYHLDNGACVPDEPCDTNPCIHGQCRVVDGQEHCDCDAGYAGELCDSCADGYHAEGLTCVPDEPNACRPNPCDAPHRTVCQLDGQGYVCLCDPGYHLEADACVPDGTDPCDPDPCTGAHEFCTPDGQGGYSC
ncbi:MAG: hypothetical protein JXR96_01740, partial [Deltaproteobacteria bacterium]|nr:hypothetical protein [Deltaproteobacteria bacterium]